MAHGKCNNLYFMQFDYATCSVLTIYLGLCDRRIFGSAR